MATPYINMTAAEVAALAEVRDPRSTVARELDVVGERAAVVADLVESWEAVDLRLILEGRHAQPVPTVLVTRDNAAAYFYPGKVNGLHGDSGIGKSWLAYAAAAQELEADHDVLILDYEATASEVVDRLRKLGASADAIIEHLTYIQPNAPTSPVALALVLEHITPTTTLALIDSIGEAFGLDGIDENSDAEVGPWLRRVARTLAAAGPAVVLIDHATKAADNPLHPSGSKRKRAAITGASYLVTAKVTPTRDSAGTLTLTCAKDRHGTYARGAVVASVDITPYPDGGVTINIHQTDQSASTIAPAEMVESVARAMVRTAKAEARPLTRNELLALAPVKARNDTKRAAVDLAVGRGALSVEDGPRRSLLHRYVCDLPEADK